MAYRSNAKKYQRILKSTVLFVGAGAYIGYDAPLSILSEAVASTMEQSSDSAGMMSSLPMVALDQMIHTAIASGSWSDPAVWEGGAVPGLSVLHECAGHSVFEPGNPAMQAILATHPHRIALTRVGRLEVYQKIGGPDTAGKSPEGQHTHVLPKLLKTGRTHSANMPIPEGWIPCAAFHPANPVIGRLGEDKDYNHQAFLDFQKLLETWGAEDYVPAKNAAWTAMKAGIQACDHHEPDSRLGRVGLRNAIRQWRRQGGDGPLMLGWVYRFDR